MPETKYACNNGDKFTHTFSVCNTGSCKCLNTEASMIVPNGIKFNQRSTMTSQGSATPSYNTGIWNPIDLKWMIGDLEGGDCKEITFEFEITDETLFEDDDFIVEFEVTSSCTEDVSDNVDYLCVSKFCAAEGSEDCPPKINAILT